MNPSTLRLLIELANINQYQLAELLGVHQTTISVWLTEKCSIPKRHNEKLTQIIGEHNVFLLNTFNGDLEKVGADIRERLEGCV
ncbi:transcriptional regulator [Bacillus cereus]|nr:transcriptional regulator [Bacillus cereus]PFH65307.1 transcriptional regulator [Bacillus cereus]